MLRVFKGLRAFRAPGLAIAGNAAMRGVGTKMGTVATGGWVRHLRKSCSMLTGLQ